MNVPIFIKYELDNYEVAEILTEELSQSIILQELIEEVEQANLYNWYIKNSKSDEQHLICENENNTVQNFIQDNLFDLEIIGEIKENGENDRCDDQRGEEKMPRKYSDSFEILNMMDFNEKSEFSRTRKNNSVGTENDSFMLIDLSNHKESVHSNTEKSIHDSFIKINHISAQQNGGISFSAKKQRKTEKLDLCNSEHIWDSQDELTTNKSLNNSPRGDYKTIELGSSEEKLSLFLKLKDYQLDHLKQITNKRLTVVKQFEKDGVIQLSKSLQTSLKNLEKITENLPQFSSNNIGKKNYKDLASMENKTSELKNNFKVISKKKVLFISADHKKSKIPSDKHIFLKEQELKITQEVSDEISEALSLGNKEKFK